MHLLFLTPAFPPFPGGGERYVRSLALNLVQREYQVTVVTSTARTEQDFWRGGEPLLATPEVDMGIQVIRCPVSPLPGGRAALLAWRKAMVLLSALPGEHSTVLLKMARVIPPIHSLDQVLAQLPGPFDLVHGFNLSWERTAIAGWRLARQRGLPFFVTPFAHLGTGTQDRVARNSTMSHQRWLLSDADKVLVLTSVERSGLIDLGVAAERIEVIGTGVDPAPPSDDTNILRRYHAQCPFALYVGRVSYDKGAIHAAQAILALRRQGQSVSLVLVGQTAPEFERFYGRLPATDQAGIRPLGILNEHDKHALLHNSAMLLLPSRTDSFGIVLLEAWTHRKPVIGARAGGIPDVIDDGKNGILIDFGDVAGLAHAIRQLLKDEVMRHSMGQYGWEKVNTVYSWDQVGQRALANYSHFITLPS